MIHVLQKNQKKRESMVSKSKLSSGELRKVNIDFFNNFFLQDVAKGENEKKHQT